MRPAPFESGSPSSTHARRRIVTPQCLDELYELIKGARFANTVLDAKASLEQRNLGQTRMLLDRVRERLEASHARTRRTIRELEEDGSRDALDRARRLIKKHEKVDLAEAELRRLLEQLQKMSDLRWSQAQAALAAEPAVGAKPGSASTTAGGSSSPTPRSPMTTPPADFLEAWRALQESPSQPAVAPERGWAVIEKYFQAMPVKSLADLESGSLFGYVDSRQRVVLVEIQNTQPTPATDDLPVVLHLIGTEQAFQPVPARKLIELGSRDKLRRLTGKSAEESPAAKAGHDRALSGQAGQAGTQQEDGRQEAAAPAGESGRGPADEGFTDPQRDQILDMGAFSQLLDAANRCGLVSGAELIGHVRDREFRRGDFAKAFQLIEGLNGKFQAAAMQRDQRLRREELDIKSGKVKMSPKELQAKRQRDTYETQLVDRARHRFLRVLEGLRILLRHDQEASEPDKLG